MKCDRGKRLQRLRSEFVERTFAHLCETGGARRTWLHGIEKVRKRYLIAAAGHNLGLLMRVLFKMGTPRGLQAAADIASSMYLAILTLCKRILRPEFAFETATACYLAPWAAAMRVAACAENVRNSTAC